MTTHSSSESGFSFIDIMIAMTLLLVGILSLTGALSIALVRVHESEAQFRAQTIALQATESAFAARDIHVPTTAGSSAGSVYFQNQIKNVADGGIFSDGRTAVHELPGPDGIFGTDDDNGPVVPNVEREIVITDLVDPNAPTNPISLKQFSVTIYYTVGTAGRTTTHTIYIGDVQRQSN